MGNINSARHGSLQNGVDSAEVIRTEFMEGAELDSMGNTPPESPASSVARSPLMFSPQIPALPILNGNDERFSPISSSVYQNEKGVPTLFQWTFGGDEVYVQGSWDDWQKRLPLKNSGNDFTVLKVLPPGVYQFNFLVDGEMRYCPDMPFTCDAKGIFKNVIDLKETLAENVENISDFEPPMSPDASYNSLFPTGEDFNEEPPGVPHQLHFNLMDVHENVSEPSPLLRPQHVVLNHLYVEKGRTVRSVLALGLTHRYHSKYVTVVLCKPIPSRTRK